MSDSLVNEHERYDFTWVGKNKAILEAGQPIEKTLRPLKEKSVDWDNTENVYIEGDNLEVLKLLQESYLNKIDVIYIDPPYNTGNDFIYNDDFKMSEEEYSEAVGEFDEYNQRMIPSKKDNARFHSDWLNMMYSRLKLARNLLSDDGVIFISIDDNEQAHLKELCDEIFGDFNSETLIWNKEFEGKSGTLKQVKRIRRTHEYIIAVYKNKQNTIFHKVNEALNVDSKKLQTANLAVNSNRENKNHENYFSITSPSGDVFTRQWKWNKDKIDELIKENLLYWGSDGHKQPRLIIPTDERRKIYLASILNYGGTTVGRKETEELLNISNLMFYPKPIKLLKKLLKTATSIDSIILDFFSGSGTTADAVMQLNAEDGGNRKFIMVQLPEKIDEKQEAYKEGYRYITEIGEERIRRAGAKVKKEHLEVDTGFRVFKVDSSNIMEDIRQKPSTLKQEELFEAARNVKKNRNDLDLLYQVMLDWGLELSLPYESEIIEETIVHNVFDGALIACFTDDLNEQLIRKIAEKEPFRVVFKDASFKDSAMKTNVVEIFKEISPETKIKVI